MYLCANVPGSWKPLFSLTLDQQGSSGATLYFDEQPESLIRLSPGMLIMLTETEAPAMTAAVAWSNIRPQARTVKLTAS